jgi:PAS domain S-box-containing protein
MEEFSHAKAQRRKGDQQSVYFLCAFAPLRAKAFFVMLLLILALLYASPVSAQEVPKKVLIFSTEDQFTPAIMIVNRAIRTTMEKRSPSHIQFFYEAQDNFRIPNEEYEAELVELLRSKYEGEKIDLIYVLGPPALRFLAKHQGEIFSDTPIVYAVLGQGRVADLNLGPNVTGLSAKVDLKPTLDTALTLHPETERVVVVAGVSSADAAFEKQARAEFRDLEGKLQFTYLIGLPLADLKNKVADLPPKSVIFYLSMTVDRTGKFYYNSEGVSVLASDANAPIYVSLQTLFGTGSIGGRLINFEAIGTQMAELGLRILAGEKPQNIRVDTIPNTPMFDWRALQRWGVNHSRLPADSVVLFRQPTFWELYKWRVVGAVSLIFLQTLLIIGLLINRAKRRKAEEESKASEARYRNVVETQTELICRYLPDTTLTFVNDAYCRHFGKNRDQLIGTRFTQLMPEQARQAALNHVTSLIERPCTELWEHEVVLPNGARGWHEWIDHVVQSNNGHGVELQGIGRDITARRQAELALRTSETRFQNLADSAPLLIWMCGPDEQCSYLNQGWLDFTGRTLAEELGTGWTAGIHPDDYEPTLKTFETAFDLRGGLRVEYRLRRADGVYRWLYVSATPRFSEEGEFLGYIGSCTDISDRKEAEEALQLAHQEVSKLKNQLEAENIYLQEEIKLAHHVNEIIGESDVIKYVLFKIEQVSQTDSTVLILGETGTGKELVARAIHNQSTRKDRPLVKVNCAALSASLIESELFGHEKGAFTGASARKIGRFELADGATIFLDEIGELPLELQAKLLRVVQEGEFERLGSTKTIKVDVRILAATNRNLKVETEKGTFREDLWYRLNVFPITVPPLRHRSEDVPKLVEHFVSALSKKVGKNINAVSATTSKKLQNYSWPGNVRELANVIERAVITAQGPVLQIADQLESAPEESTTSTRTLEEVEKEYIVNILDAVSWKIEGPNGAAKRLGLNPSTLRTRMAKLGIQRSLRAIAGNSHASQ